MSVPGAREPAARGLAFMSLSGTIAWEAIAGQSPPDRASRPETPIQAKRQPGPIEPANQIDRRLNDILARLNFSPDRRPVASGARRTTGLSRLTGIVVSGLQKIAIFAAPSGGYPLAAQEGEHVGGYEVREITSAGVTVSVPEGTTIITPMFDPGARPADTSRANGESQGAGETYRFAGPVAEPEQIGSRTLWPERNRPGREPWPASVSERRSVFRTSAQCPKQL